ncbi:FAD-dependent oxidoreductase [Muricomes sp. OA1]|uniref:MBL fold metallo-hydrolase n=1 Tax=Hungatella hathewayi TaxID=154046 RepID=A0A3E2X175_9FIRM|nr:MULTISPECIES: FAD-dependent oxidoreductase [Clostridia]MCH1971151.1 FAD-dependent oxidoreductase [Muricomes sp. OA1]RGC35037.1 MBL fold metallo-hydrolase [Hungatella hathewayi]GKH34448.1 oxidoreductase [Faecalicatena contorta]
MKSLKLREGFYWTGIVDDSLRVFDIIMYTEFGTTYNSYVLKAGDKTILFETAKEKFWDDYLEKLEEVTTVSEIDYLVVSHTEPDHAGSVERLLDMCPHLKIISTGTANGFLKEIVNRDFTGIVVKDGQSMRIGNKTLYFMAVPNLHWPDTMYTYIEEEQILVTCDSFGSHYGFHDVLLSRVENWEDYEKATKYYFDCIIGPFKSYMIKALERVRQLDITMICTGHGPVLDTKLEQIYQWYEKWCDVRNPNQKKTVIIAYVSAYGYTKELAENIAEGIRECGDIDIRLYDMVEADPGKAVEELGFADGILFGTPTIVGEALKPIWDLTLAMTPVTHGGKLAGVFGSYGWSGEGVPHIEERLKQLRMQVVEGYQVRFRPDQADRQDAFDFGYNFGCILLDRPNTKKKTAESGLVKCLVCGEIFDASLEICPVCGVGKENFVPVEVEESSYRKDTEDFYLILGNGAAGYQAAKAIRDRDKTASVVMISDEPYRSYNRPMLTKSIMAELDEDQIAIQDERWYQEQRIVQVLGKKVASVDTKEKEVSLEDGTRLKYTKLIYALGGECFIPPIPGSDKEAVVAIRRLKDTRKIADLLPKVKNVVVIGGGVLGLEAAWEMKKAKCRVTVLEIAPVLMGRQLDASAGELLKDIGGECGINIRTGVQPEEILGEERVTAVRLNGGEEIPADMVIISSGVRANIGLAEQMGLETDRGVVVNGRMETSMADVYACGDCAQYQNVNYAIWPEAVEQGKVAGANAAGEEVEYEQVPAALTFNGMNTALYAVGDTGKNPNLVYKTVEFKDMGRKQYKKYYFLNNRLCGVILIGDVAEMGKMGEAVEKRMAYGEVMKG